MSQFHHPQDKNKASMAHACNLDLRKLRQGDIRTQPGLHSEFQVSLESDQGRKVWPVYSLHIHVHMCPHIYICTHKSA